MEQRPCQYEKLGFREAQEEGDFQQRGVGSLVAADGLGALQESGEHVVGQLRHWIFDGEMGFLHGMYSTMDPELEVQGTIQEGGVNCLHFRAAAQGVARRVYMKIFHPHVISCLFLCFVFFFRLSCLYVLCHFYLFSVPNFNSQDVENAEH